MIVLFAGSIEHFKSLKHHTFLKKKSIICIICTIICSKYENENEKIFKKEQSIEILKIIGLFKDIITLQIWLKENKLRLKIKKYRWNKKLLSWTNRASWIDE